MKKLDKLIFKYLGWLLYPKNKLGKEEQHKKMCQDYDGK